MRMPSPAGAARHVQDASSKLSLLHLLSSLAAATTEMGKASSSMVACRISQSMQGILYCFCRPACLQLWQQGGM